MSKFVPNSARHAIDQAVVGIRLFEPASEQAYLAAVNEAARLASPDQFDLPGRLQVDPLSLVFGRQVIAPGYAVSGELAPGSLFQKVKPDGQMEEELTVEKNVVTFRTRNYQRWVDMARRIDGLLAPVASILAEGDILKVSVIELRCIDVFRAEGDAWPALSALVRDGSRYVPTQLLDRKDQLHIHSGWFEDEGNAGRLLINLNIDVADRNDTVRTATVLQAVSKQSKLGSGLFAGDPNFAVAVGKVFNELHSRDKILLSEVLTADLQEAIDLKGSSGIG